MSGSLFRANIQAAAETFRLVRGRPEDLCQDGGKRGEAGAGVLRGLRYGIVRRRLRTIPTSYWLRVGTITQRAMFRPTHQIWCQSELPWTWDVGGLERRDRG